MRCKPAALFCQGFDKESLSALIRGSFVDESLSIYNHTWHESLWTPQPHCFTKKWTGTYSGHLQHTVANVSKDHHTYTSPKHHLCLWPICIARNGEQHCSFLHKSVIIVTVGGLWLVRMLRGVAYLNVVYFLTNLSLFWLHIVVYSDSGVKMISNT